MIEGVSDPQACNPTRRTGTGSSEEVSADSDWEIHSSMEERSVDGVMWIVLCVIGPPFALSAVVFFFFLRSTLTSQRSAPLVCAWSPSSARTCILSVVSSYVGGLREASARVRYPCGRVSMRADV
jgi:hypothetical protein